LKRGVFEAGAAFLGGEFEPVERVIDWCGRIRRL